MKKNLLFVLGGWDLEMETIRDLLERHKYPFFDERLSWDKADVRMYVDRMDAVFNQYDEIYGIELKNDSGRKLPPNYKLIDHHNEYSDRKSALEQVAEIIGVRLTDYEKLVAANDRGYIPAMEKAGASKEQIAEIRQKDRAAQGVTPEDEKAAEEAIKYHLTTIGDLRIVQTSSPRFSPVCDRLYPYVHLIVHTDNHDTDNQLCYYGPLVPKLVEVYTAQIKRGQVFYGGNGSYLGTCKVEQGFNEQITEKIIRLIEPKPDPDPKPERSDLYSTHIFLLPFTLEAESERKAAETASWIKEVFKSDNDWVPSCISYENDYAKAFSLQAYFYEHVADAMFTDTNEDTDNALSVYEYDKVNPTNSFYRIDIRNEKNELKEGETDEDRVKKYSYELQLEKITLNIYCSGICVLALHCSNTRYPELKDILNINEYGRRFYPQFFVGEDGNMLKAPRNSFLAEKITISANNKTFSDDFTGYTVYQENVSPFKLPNHIAALLPADFRGRIHWPIDDRMFVVCWYGNDDLSKEIACYDEGLDKYDYQTNPHVYEYIFVDKYGDCSCQNRHLLKQSIEESTNARWIDYGTLYGVTNYSFVALTDHKEFSKKLCNDVNTFYYFMACLVLAQRATILQFTKEVYHITTTSAHEDIMLLNEHYSKCLNKMFFSEVSAQQQGEELYALLQRQMHIERHRKNLESEIDRLYDHAGAIYSHNLNQNSLKLNWVAYAFAPLTVALAFVGISDPYMVSQTLHLPCWWLTLGIFLLCIFTLSVVAYKLVKYFLKRCSRSGSRSRKRMKHSSK